jgi:hypothetical protein
VKLATSCGIELRPTRYRFGAGLLITLIVSTVPPAGCFGSNRYAGSKKDQDSLERTGNSIRAAFCRGDIEDIRAYHDPDVVKGLGFHKYLIGRKDRSMVIYVCYKLGPTGWASIRETIQPA